MKIKSTRGFIMQFFGESRDKSESLNWLRTIYTRAHLKEKMDPITRTRGINFHLSSVVSELRVHWNPGPKRASFSVQRKKWQMVHKRVKKWHQKIGFKVHSCLPNNTLMLGYWSFASARQEKNFHLKRKIITRLSFSKIHPLDDFLKTHPIYEIFA